jgi:hypothetical protein
LRLIFRTERLLQEQKCLGGRVHESEQLEVSGVDHSGADERVEVEQLTPIFRAVEEGNLAIELSRLRETVTRRASSRASR